MRSPYRDSIANWLHAPGSARSSVDINVQGTTLLVYRSGLLQDIPGSDSLVYEVEAGNGSTVREFLYVDAFDGQIVDQISGIERNQEAPESLSRQISETSLANVKWTNPPDPDPIPGGLGRRHGAAGDRLEQRGRRRQRELQPIR